MKVKTIVFDIGNVIIRFKPWEDILPYYEKDDAALLYKEIFCNNEWVELDRGSLEQEDAIRSISQRTPGKEALVRDCLTKYYSRIKPITGTMETIKRLKGNGYGLLYLSNYHRAGFSYLLDTYPVFGLFDGGIASCHVGLLKPQPGIYRMLMEQYRLDPKDILFIDDTRANVDAASKEGMQVLHLPDPALLNSRLEELRIFPITAGNNKRF